MHLIAWFESQDSATLVDVNNLADTSITREGADGYQIPSLTPELFAGAALGVSLTEARFTAPSLERSRSTVNVWPKADAAESFALTHPQIWMPRRSIPLDPGEVLRFQAAEDGGAAAVAYGLAFLKGAGDLPSMPPGPIIQARATSASTLTVDIWNTVDYTLEQELSAGEYAVVGFISTGVSQIAARLVIPGASNRPGLPAFIGATTNVAQNADFGILDKLMYYNMGQFKHTALPSLEVLASAADTAEEVQFLLVKVS